VFRFLGPYIGDLASWFRGVELELGQCRTNIYACCKREFSASYGASWGRCAIDITVPKDSQGKANNHDISVRFLETTELMTM